MRKTSLDKKQDPTRGGIFSPALQIALQYNTAAITSQPMNCYKLFLIVLASLSIAACDMHPDMHALSSNKEGSAARVIAANNGCMGCHAVSNKIVGPAWKKVSQRYKNTENAKALLIAKIKSGGKGSWNNETKGKTMPGFEGRMTDEEISIVVDYILALDATVKN